MIERREAICRHANWNGIRNELRRETGGWRAKRRMEKCLISFNFSSEERRKVSEMTERMELNWKIDIFRSPPSHGNVEKLTPFYLFFIRFGLLLRLSINSINSRNSAAVQIGIITSRVLQTSRVLSLSPKSFSAPQPALNIRCLLLPGTRLQLIV